MTELDPATATPPYVTIVGPTASGKSALALELAQALCGEIVNSDSVQLYRGLDIGAAKPSQAEQALVPHHLLDIVEPYETVVAATFARFGQQTITSVAARGKVPVVVGGSGLYLRALWGDRFHDLPRDPELREELKGRSEESLYAHLLERDPERAREIHPRDKFRVARALEIVLASGKTTRELTGSSPQLEELSFRPRCVVMLNPPREQLHAGIELRTRKMLDAGLVAEVEGLLTAGLRADCKALQSIGYKQVLEHLRGDLPADLLLEKIVVATRQYAKRQLTWFGKVKSHVTLSAYLPKLDPSLREHIREFLEDTRVR